MTMHWKILILLLCLLCASVVASNAKLKALWNLEEMSTCKLGYPATAYNNYGCWCGVGGSGKPMDGIDRCCMFHDLCYDDAVNRGHCYDTAEEYVWPYRWQCNKTQPVCLDNASTGCAAALCDCDRRVVECWSRFRKPEITVKCVKINSTKMNRHSRRAPKHKTVFGKIINALEAAVLQHY